MKKKQILWIDVIRAIACFMVVFLHAAVPVLHSFNELPLNDWFAGNVYDSLVRVCVPLFFMISGFLLLQKDETLSIYFAKRFGKLFIPIIFWSLFFVLWTSLVEENSLPSFTDFTSILLTPSYYHLWFLYALIGLYLFLPILRKVVSYSDESMLIYYVGVWFIAVSLMPTIEKISGIDSRIDLGAASGYIGFFVLGLLLGKKDVSTQSFYKALSVFIICVAVTAIGTYDLTAQNNGKFVGDYYEYLSPNVIIAAGACFMMLKYLSGKITSVWGIKVITLISSCSFGIYLVHTVFIYLLKNGDLGFTFSALSGNPLWAIPLTSLLVFTLSFLSIYLIKKVPYLKQVAP